DPDTGRELWVSDGTQSGTHLFADILPGSDGSYPGDLTVASSKLFFTANTAGYDDLQMWVSDGTTVGTKWFKSHLVDNQRPANLVAQGGKVYYNATSPGLIPEPDHLGFWSTNGSSA